MAAPKKNNEHHLLTSYESLSFFYPVSRLSSVILDVIANDLKFEHMTPVQAATIPAFLSHKDVAVQVTQSMIFLAWSTRVGVLLLAYLL